MLNVGVEKVAMRKLHTGRQRQGFFFSIFVIRICFLRTLISSFVKTQIFSVDSPQSFINEAPGLHLHLSVHTHTVGSEAVYILQC